MYVAHERRAYLLRLLEQHGYLRSAELARDLGVTDETIRTDLVALQKQGLLRRVHGGARYILPAAKASGAPSGPDNSMADELAGLITPGMCLYLDACPFSLLLAWRLRDTPCRLVTASPKLLTQLGAKALEHSLFCPGGELDKESGLIRPVDAQAYLESMAPDMAVLRPTALTPTHMGYTAPLQAQWAQAAMQTARTSCAAVHADALQAQAPCTFAARPGLVITEGDVDELQEDFPGIRTVPYISRESLLPADRFDY